MLFTQEGTDLTRIYPKGFLSLFGTSEIRMRYSEYLCGLSLSFAGNKRWAFGVYFFTNIFIIQHHFLFVNTKNKIFNDFFIRYFCKSFIEQHFSIIPYRKVLSFLPKFQEVNRSQQDNHLVDLLASFFMPVYRQERKSLVIFCIRIIFKQFPGLNFKQSAKGFYVFP